MDNRTVIFPFDELVADPKKIGRALTDLCNNMPLKYEVRGAALLSHRIVFMLEKKRGVGDILSYVVDEIGPVSDDELVGLINGRWQGGYTTVAALPIYESCFGLFEKREVVED